MINLSNLAVFTSFYFLLPTMAIFVSEVLGGNEGDVGYIIGILSFTALLVRPFSGYLVDTMGRKRILQISVFAFALTIGAYRFVTSLFFLLLLRAVHGMTWGFTTTSAGTVAADVVPASRRGEGLGYYGLSNTLAMAIGPSMALLILQYSDFSTLFLVAFMISLAAFLFIQGISYQETTQKRQKSKITFESLFEPKVFSLALLFFFLGMVYSGIVSFITLYAKELNVQNAGIFFLIYALTLLVIRPIAGTIFDRQGPYLLMPIGYVAMILSFVLLYLAQGQILFIAAAIMLGIGFGLVHPTSMALAINRVPAYRRGAANGTVFSAFDLGLAGGAANLGWLSSMVGLQHMYLISGCLTILPMLFFLFYESPKIRQIEEVS